VNDADETYTFEFIQSTVTALTSPDVLASGLFTNAQAATDLVAGKKVILLMPPGRITKRHIGLRATLAGTTPGITYTAYIAGADMAEIHKYYADAVTITG
jgi:hypothetical protein